MSHGDSVETGEESTRDSGYLPKTGRLLYSFRYEILPEGRHQLFHLSFPSLRPGSLVSFNLRVGVGLRSRVSRLEPPLVTPLFLQVIETEGSQTHEPYACPVRTRCVDSRSPDKFIDFDSLPYLRP